MFMQMARSNLNPVFCPAKRKNDKEGFFSSFMNGIFYKADPDRHLQKKWIQTFRKNGH